MTPTGRLSKEQYQQLAPVCVESLLQGNFRSSVDIILPKKTKLPPSFPQGRNHAELNKDIPEGYVCRTILAQTLLKWLHKKGYSQWSVEDVWLHKRSFQAQLNAMFNKYDIDFDKSDVDISQENLYNDGIEIEEEQDA